MVFVIVTVHNLVGSLADIVGDILGMWDLTRTMLYATIAYTTEGNTPTAHDPLRISQGGQNRSRELYRHRRLERKATPFLAAYQRTELSILGHTLVERTRLTKPTASTLVPFFASLRKQQKFHLFGSATQPSCVDQPQTGRRHTTHQVQGVVAVHTHTYTHTIAHKHTHVAPLTWCLSGTRRRCPTSRTDRRHSPRPDRQQSRRMLLPRETSLPRAC